MKKTFHAGAGLLLIALAFLAFNILLGQLPGTLRLDLTEQKLYTLSGGTERLLDELDEPIDLYFFYSDRTAKTVVPLRNYARRVEEMLKAYQRAANGKLRLHIIDPEPFSEDEDQAAEFGLQAVPLNQAGEQVYFGLAGTNVEGDRQVIPFFPLDREAFLEYEISRLVHGLAHPRLPVVGVLSSLPMSGGFDIAQGQPTPPWMVMEEIRQLFHIESLEPGIDQIPRNVSVLLLVHPKNLPEQTLYAIDQFVLSGGKLLAFVDPFSEADSGAGTLADGAGEDRSSDLEPLFKAWGLRLRPGEVLADGAYAMAVGMGPGEPPVRHAAWLELPAEALDQDDVCTAGLESLTVASAGMLEPLASASTRFLPLIRSSRYAMPFAVARFEALDDPEALIRELRPSGVRYSIAARIEGPAKSAFPEGIEGRKDGLKKADNVNLIVVADSDLLTDRLWVQVQNFFGQRIPQPFADNADFVVNVLDNLSGSEALIGLRSRGRFSRPFEVVEDLRREAEARFRSKEQVLQQRLADTERKLAVLQPGEESSRPPELTREQLVTLQQFLEEKRRIRRELRDVRYRLNADIEALGRRLKFLDIALIPLLLTVAVLVGWLWRKRGRSE